MNESLLNSIWQYFTTLKYTGEVSSKEVKRLFIVLKLIDIYKYYVSKITITEEEEKLLNRIIKCLVKKSCFIPKDIERVSISKDTSAIITNASPNKYITALSGNTQIPINGGVVSFPQFNIKNVEDIEGDQYIVGYDESDNKEFRVNIQDIGVYWENGN